MRLLKPLALACLIAASLTACQKDDAPQNTAAAVAEATESPAGAVQAAVAALRKNDLATAIRVSVPESEYAEMQQAWTRKKAEGEITEEERKEFAETMARLTAADAETALYAEFEPLLAKFEAETAAQMPMMIAMGQGFIMQSIQTSEDLTAEQKQQAGDMLTATATWLQTAKLTDRELAKKSIARVVAAARESGLKDLDALHALDFEGAMKQGGIAFGAFKDVLGYYGMNIDAMLDSVKSEVVSTEGDMAKVKVTYNFFDKPMGYETEMQRDNGRWFSKDMLAQVQQQRAAAEAALADDGSSDDAAMMVEEEPAEAVEESEAE